MVHALTEELVRRGHEVTLFASGDSITSAQLISITPKALREMKIKDLYGINMWAMLNVGLAYQMQDQFDIIHDHTGYLSLAAANISKTPVVATMHGSFNSSNSKIYQALRNPYVVTISKSQRVVPNLNYAGTVYNGLDMKNYPFADTHDGYLLFVGRICLEKGTHFAVEVAQMLGLPLIIAAKLESTDVPYFREYIEPFLSEQIKWIGEVTEEERNKLMSRALCFLHPATWREPFGLVLIEAMACGCPVIAFNKGSIPELVNNGQTGYVVSDAEEMAEAIIKIDQIDRAQCRKHALQNFSAEKMTDGYEEIYYRILSRAENGHRKNQFPLGIGL